MTSQAVTEPLVDAKDDARHAESRVGFERAINRVTWRLISLVIAFVLGSAGLIITVLR